MKMPLWEKRWKVAVALLATMAFAGFAASAAIGRENARSCTRIRSGAGPNWPKTISSCDFVRRVDNPWWPLRPGSRWFYRGVEGRTREVDIQRVTHRTKMIEGVRATVVHDQVLIHGKRREITRDFYAQDKNGNVWYMGENTRDVNRHGHVTSREGSFLAGKGGARPGILISGHPKVGDRARQEYLKGRAADHFAVIARPAHVSVPYVTTSRALETKEWSPLEPHVLDHKYYVHGVGDVREVAVKGPKERLRLISFRKR